MNRIVAVAQMALCLVFVFCNNGGGQTRPAELVGHWVEMSEKNGNVGKSKMELFKDGTGVSDDKSISWKVENKRFVILSSNKGLSCDYDVSSYELILFEDNGNNKVYVKKEIWDIWEPALKAAINGEYDKAITVWSEVIKKYPNYVGTYSSRAEAYSRKGDNDKALADYTKIIQIGKRPSDIIGAYMGRGYIYFAKVEDYDKAIKDFELTLQKVSSSSADDKFFVLLGTKKEELIEILKNLLDSAKEEKGNK